MNVFGNEEKGNQITYNDVSAKETPDIGHKSPEDTRNGMLPIQASLEVQQATEYRTKDRINIHNEPIVKIPGHFTIQIKLSKFFDCQT